MNLDSIFSGSIGVNGFGIAGLVVMVIGACLVFMAGKIAPSKIVLLKSIGCIVCAVGAAVVIAIGK